MSREPFGRNRSTLFAVTISCSYGCRSATLQPTSSSSNESPRKMRSSQGGANVLERAGIQFPSSVCNSRQRLRSHLGMVNGCRTAFIQNGSRGFVPSVPPLSVCMSRPPRSWLDPRTKSGLPPASERGRANGAVVQRNPNRRHAAFHSRLRSLRGSGSSSRLPKRHRHGDVPRLRRGVPN